MRSPEELAVRLAKQWYNADTREQRLLNSDSWPLRINIGKPSGGHVTEQFEHVRAHINRWRGVDVGTVELERVSFRGIAEPIDVPRSWTLASPSEWVEATGSGQIKSEYQRLARVVAASDPIFHRLLVRRRQIFLERDEAEVIKAANLALLLEPGCAAGAPLRALSLAGIDSKFIERNRYLLLALLDVRFDGLVSDLGLEDFLGALNTNDHWLLVADLDGSLLCFSQQRVRDKELFNTNLPADHILVVENERSLHQLPKADNVIAILGSGLNLAWMDAPWLDKKRVGYWGDIDTWGLLMLGRARTHQSSLTPLLMSETEFDKYGEDHAVPEPNPAGQIPPQGLNADEEVLYSRLLRSEKGRLEQEFLPSEAVALAVANWLSNAKPAGQ
jgi:hypothetical protein